MRPCSPVLFTASTVQCTHCSPQALFTRTAELKPAAPWRSGAIGAGHETMARVFHFDIRYASGAPRGSRGTGATKGMLGRDGRHTTCPHTTCQRAASAREGLRGQEVGRGGGFSVGLYWPESSISEVPRPHVVRPAVASRAGLTGRRDLAGQGRRYAARRRFTRPSRQPRWPPYPTPPRGTESAGHGRP